MRILLDECVTRKAKRLFPEHEVSTVSEKGLSGTKNGKLLAETEKQGFDMLLTIDKNMDAQQDISKFGVILVVFDVLKSGLRFIEELMPKFKEQLADFGKGKTYVIRKET